MMIGGRQGPFTGFRKALARAMARNLRAFVIPGPDVARAHGLNLGAAGFEIVATPRHANVLVVVGTLPQPLGDAATVAYAQMPRPRAILSVGAGGVPALPAPDATAGLSQSELNGAVSVLRTLFADHAFAPDVTDFDAPALSVKIEYTCPMHAEIVRDEPGNCPICGMTLVERETSAGGHAGHEGMGHSSEEMSGMDHSAHGTAKELTSETGDAPGGYTCPMHPEVQSKTPGSCPKCGMTLVPMTKSGDHKGHAAKNAGSMDHSAHGKMDHSEHGAHKPEMQGHQGHNAKATEHSEDTGVEPQFMSMVEMTRDMPVSSDGLKMEWIDVAFGPFHPGLPGGLTLKLTLDGDTVASANVRGVMDLDAFSATLPCSPQALADRLSDLSPHSQTTYAMLVWQAVEAATEVTPDQTTHAARQGALVYERLIADLGWIANLAQTTGARNLLNQATILQLDLRDGREAGVRRSQLSEFVAGLKSSRFFGPRFASITFATSDVTAHDLLHGRLARMARDIEALKDLVPIPAHKGAGKVSGKGSARIETARGYGDLDLTLSGGKVTQMHLRTPSAARAKMVSAITAQQEIGDALSAVALLDIDPWEVPQ